jgi:hypothetical protein
MDRKEALAGCKKHSFLQKGRGAGKKRGIGGREKRISRLN